MELIKFCLFYFFIQVPPNKHPRRSSRMQSLKKSNMIEETFMSLLWKDPIDEITYKYYYALLNSEINTKEQKSTLDHYLPEPNQIRSLLKLLENIRNGWIKSIKN